MSPLYANGLELTVMVGTGRDAQQRTFTHGDELPSNVQDVDRYREAGAIVDAQPAPIGTVTPGIAPLDAPAVAAPGPGGSPDVAAPADMDDAALATWVGENNATAVVDAGKGDPALAQRLIAAEQTSSGGDPRSTVVKPLGKVVDDGSSAGGGGGQ